MELLDVFFDKTADDQGYMARFSVQLPDVPTVLAMLTTLYSMPIPTPGTATDAGAGVASKSVQAASPSVAQTKTQTPKTTESRIVKTPIGEVTLSHMGTLGIKAVFGEFEASGKDDKEAMVNLLALIKEKRVTTSTTPALTSAPAGATTQAPTLPASTAPSADDDFGAPTNLAPLPAGLPDVPPVELINAAGLRPIMQYLIDRKVDDGPQVMIVLERWKPAIPALQRLAGELADRVNRALTALKPTA